MALEFNNTNGKTKVPLKRNNKFFGDEDFDLENDFAIEYLEQDANQTVILYQVDLSKTKVDDVYKEADKNAVRYKTPIEIPVIYDISDAELKAYNSKTQRECTLKQENSHLACFLKLLKSTNAIFQEVTILEFRLQQHRESISQLQTMGVWE